MCTFFFIVIQTQILYNFIGRGTTNDGNTARRFFQNPEQTANITGVDLNLITRFGVILRTLACGMEIDSDRFDKYAIETAQLYVKLYPWYYMPSSVHKILIHGADVIRCAILPIGNIYIYKHSIYIYIIYVY